MKTLDQRSSRKDPMTVDSVPLDAWGIISAALREEGNGVQSRKLKSVCFGRLESLDGLFAQTVTRKEPQNASNRPRAGDCGKPIASETWLSGPEWSSRPLKLRG